MPVGHKSKCIQRTHMHPRDIPRTAKPYRQRFQEQVTLENVLREIQRNGSFSISYRLLMKDEPRPVTLKAALFREGDEEKLVVGVRAWKRRMPEK